MNPKHPVPAVGVYDPTTGMVDITRGERREARIDNGRKMKVTGRSTLLLGALSAGQQRRRVSRRKTGAR